MICDPPHFLDYLTNSVDRVLLLHNPMLMMPREAPEDEALPPLDIGERRYVAAADGIYVQARSAVLTVTLKYASTPPLPYGRLRESIRLVYGLIPRANLDEIVQQACAYSPLEWAGLVMWDHEKLRYYLDIPPCVERSTHRIRYDTEGLARERMVVNVHSHGEAGAYFSDEDDVSDCQGIYIASVIGRCGPGWQLCSRVVIDGFHYTLRRHPWIASPKVINLQRTGAERRS